MAGAVALDDVELVGAVGASADAGIGRGVTAPAEASGRARAPRRGVDAQPRADHVGGGRRRERQRDRGVAPPAGRRGRGIGHDVDLRLRGGGAVDA